MPLPRPVNYILPKAPPDQQLQITKFEISSFKIEVKCKSYMRSKCEIIIVFFNFINLKNNNHIEPPNMFTIEL
jgi:hypothetical protein